MGFFQENFLTPQTAEFMPKPEPVYIPPPEDEFELTYTLPVRELLTDTELVAIPAGSVFCFDSEVYVNFILFAFKHCDSGKYLSFKWPLDLGKLKWVLQRFLIIGFNNRYYDMLIVSLALSGASHKELKTLSDKIINGKLLPYQFEQSYRITVLPVNSIDILEVCPLTGSLKLYAGRLHCKRMQDLPIHEDAFLNNIEQQQIEDYCFNDIDNTELVFNFLKPQLELRYNLSSVYHVDLRSKSDAQIAETVISHELTRVMGVMPRKPFGHVPHFYYNIPPFLHYHSQVLKEMLAILGNTPFTFDDKGRIEMPELIKHLDLRIGKSTYRMGVGGLHSTEESVVRKADDGILLLDRDVASYYPAIMLNQGLFPKHLGQSFLEVYGSLVQRRLNAKKAGNKVISDALKITINGTFGKLGNQYSLLYSPELLFQVTLSGQLCLLLLIDMIESKGWGLRVASANTDGVLIECHYRMRETLNSIVKQWESITGFVTEETEYSAVYSRDVNNYIAFKKNGESKTKGCYSEKGSAGDSPLSRNPEAFVTTDAVIAFLAVGTPVEETIYNCKDIRRFVVVRNVRNGAVKSGKYLGKTVRWYYSTKIANEIRYKVSGNTVSMSKGGKPLMELVDEMPLDINYERYIELANDILVELGVRKPDPYKRGQLFTFYKK